MQRETQAEAGLETRLQCGCEVHPRDRDKHTRHPTRRQATSKHRSTVHPGDKARGRTRSKHPTLQLREELRPQG